MQSGECGTYVLRNIRGNFVSFLFFVNYSQHWDTWRSMYDISWLHGKLQIFVFVVNTRFNELNTAEPIRSSYRRRVTFNSSVGRFLNKYCIIQRPYWFSFISSFCFCFVFKDFYSRFLWSYFNLFLTWHKNNKQNLLNYTEVTIENRRMSSVELYLFRLVVVAASPPKPFVVHSTAGFGVSSRISWHFRKLSKFALGNDMTWSNRESLGDDFSQENRPNLTL